jgi:hypothetical protein
METDVSETLHDKGLVFPSGCETNHIAVFLMSIRILEIKIINLIVDEEISAVENTSSSCRDSSVDTTLRNWLSSDTSGGVEIGWV